LRQTVNYYVNTQKQDTENIETMNVFIW